VSLRQLLNQVLPAGRIPRKRRAGLPLAVEELEPRTVLAALQLVSPADALVPPSDGAGSSSEPKPSADGRFVVYTSSASNLVPGQLEASPVTNVFLYDRQGGTTTLVSHVAGSPLITADAASVFPRISGDGRYVTYSSQATDLVAGQTGPRGVLNVFLYDRLSGLNTLVSHDAGSTTRGGNGDSDVTYTDGFGFDNNTGQFLVYISRATDLVAGQAGGAHANVFLYDVASDTSTLVSHAYGADLTGAGDDAGDADISQDGNVIAFDDLAGNLVNQQSGAGVNVFLYNRTTGTTVLVSGVNGSASAGAGGSVVSALSADGGTVVFESNAPDLITGQGPSDGFYNLYRYQSATGTTVLVSGVDGSPSTPSFANSDLADVSADGTVVVFRSDATDLVAGQTGPTGNICLYQASGSTQTVSLVSHVAGSTTTAAGGTPSTLDLIDLTISLDGSVAAYQSTAGNLVPGQTGPAGRRNVFLYDTTTGANTLVSGSEDSTTTGGDQDSRQPRLSPDGSTVVFISEASDLVPVVNKTNPTPDVFVYPAAGGGTQLVSRSALPGSAVSLVESTSADGRFVVFTSNAVNLVPLQTDNNFDQDVFLLDRDTGTVTLVSHKLGSLTTTGNAGSPNTTFGSGTPGVPAVISADGSFIAFVSSATDLVADQPPQPAGDFRNVFLYDCSTGTITLVSRTSSAFIYSDHPALSGDGRYLTFVSQATDLVPGQTAPPDVFNKSNVFLYDRLAGTTVLVSGSSATTTGDDNSTNPRINAAGSFVVYQSQATDLISGATVPPRSNVFAFNRARATNALVSHLRTSSMAAADDASTDPVISADGSAVAFVSAATDLVDGQTADGASGFTNVFRYDTGSGVLSLVSGAGGSAAVTGNGDSDSPAIDADGRYVAYRSDATDLVTGQAGPARSNVYELDALARTQTLVSHKAGAPTTPAAGVSEAPDIDGAGDLVVYLSTGTDLIPGQQGGGVNNVFLYSQALGANGLLSGQDGSTVVASARPAFQARVSARPLVTFNSSGGLLTGARGASAAYANTVISASLSVAGGMLPGGTGPGALVGTFVVTDPYAGQEQPRVTYTLVGPYPDDASFQVSGGNLLAAATIDQPSYTIQVRTDLGLPIYGLNTLTIPVAVPVPGPIPPGPPLPASHPLGARLVSVRGPRRKTRLLIEVFLEDTEVVEQRFLSPFQKPAFTNIQVSIRQGAGGDQVVVTARQRRRSVTQTYPA
jgi:hypothetical protein